MREGCALKALDRWWWVLVIPGAMAAYRVLFLAFLSRLTLAEDEAQYWDWSRYPDWGYFTKPGGVAWSIWASTAVFGDSEFAVRLPAVTAGFIGSVAVGLLALDIFRDRRIAALSSAAYLCVPAFAALGFLMTIDGPVMASWAVAAWAGHRAVLKNNRCGWVWLGLAIAIGMQFKPTMLLIIPGVLLYIVITKHAPPPPEAATNSPTESPAIARKSHAGPIALALIIVAAGFVPTLIYNAQHGWVQIAHLLDHLGIQLHEVAETRPQPRAPWSPMWTLEYPLIQIATGGSVAVLGIIAAIKLFMRSKQSNATEKTKPIPVRSVLWCVCLAVPLLVFYFAVSFFTRVEANWPIAAWVTACPLAGWAALEGFRVNDRGLKFGTWFSLALGVLIPAVLLAAPILHSREIGPTHRVIGFAVASNAVDEARGVLRDRTGSEPFVMAVSYGRTAQLAFKLSGFPTVYCTARYTSGGQGRQYDLWSHTDLENDALHASLESRDAVTMGKDAVYWARAFDSVELYTTVSLEPGKQMRVFLCAGYHGFDR